MKIFYSAAKSSVIERSIFSGLFRTGFRPLSILLFSLALFAFTINCAATTKVVATAGVMAGTISSSQADSMIRVAEATEKTFEDITPEQEYYIGRSVGASILAKYPPYENSRANHYLNQVGQSLALFSSQPETFSGYRFLILDSDEINAFAAPGGFIFVSKGMIRLCESEDDLAGVLAHEIAHVALKHGTGAIETSRLTSALTILGTESAKSLGGKELAAVTTAFEGSIHDVTGTLIDRGYSRSKEEDADEQAVRTLIRAGYDPRGLERVLVAMGKGWKSEGPGFMKTHPDPEDRIDDVRDFIDDHRSPTIPEVRVKRFQRAMAAIL